MPVTAEKTAGENCGEKVRFAACTRPKVGL